MHLIRLTELKTQKIGPCLWVLTDTLEFTDGLRKYIVPSGFLTDGASTPRAMWSVCPPMAGLTAEPAVLHDWFYSKSCSEAMMERIQADTLFLEAMKDAGVSRWRRDLVYRGVRVGGWASYQKLYNHEKATAKSQYKIWKVWGYL